MFQGMIEFPVVAYVDNDPGADDYLPLWVAPRKAQIVSAYALVTNDVGGDTANYFELALVNGGTAGTGTTAIAAAIGGAAGWTGLLPVAFTVATPELAAGEVVALHYNEEGTGTFTAMAIQLNIRYGDA